MTSSVVDHEIESLPLAPKTPLNRRELIGALGTFPSGLETLRDAGGPVSLVSMVPAWVMQPVVVVFSPSGVRDILGRNEGLVEKARVFTEMRRLLGRNLLDLPHEPWLPRRRTLQPVFTKQRVRAFGGHMAQAAQSVADSWSDGDDVDLDAECRRITLRALGRSVLGLDLDDRSHDIADPLRVSLQYIYGRGARAIRAPRWLRTPARRRARAASDTLHRLADDILQGCRADPTRDAPLVQALIEASDPDTGLPLSDEAIRDELIVFMLAGHDTTSTTLTYALWALGHNRDIQKKVRAEALAIGDRELTPDDVPALRYTVQVLHEALRLCPPVAAVPRTVMHDCVVDGHRIEAGTMVIVGTYAIHRDPALWNRPQDFDPDRFNAENSEGRDRWQYIPFGAGPRSCIGDHFAMLEASLALATIVRRIEIQSLDEDFPTVSPLTTVAGGPIHARIEVAP